MNLSREEKIMDFQNRLVVAKREGEGEGKRVGWLGNMGLQNVALRSNHGFRNVPGAKHGTDKKVG